MLGDPAPAPFDPALLRGSRELRMLGVDPARAGWHHVRHGSWISREVWTGLTAEQRHAAFVHATDLSCRTPGRHVYALESAAALWGLPRIGRWPRHVTVLSVGPRTRGSRLVHVHVGAETAGVPLHGLRVTDPARTVVDLARLGSFETALCSADHALRHGLCTAEELTAAAGFVAPRVRGRPAARLVAALADARAMSPGESLSRAQMFRLGLPRPDLQVRLQDEDGLIGFADFGWNGVVGEFDGQRKYTVPQGGDVEDAEAALWREKLREDRIRRLVRLARWTWADAMAPARLARVLAAEGIRPVPRPLWVDLGSRPAA